MGIMSALTGNAGELSAEDAAKKFGRVLSTGEHVQAGYQLFRDAFIFTNKRIIFLDVQGVTGKKMEFHSVPYKSISHFAIETAGTNDWDAELKIYVSSHTEPTIKKKFNKQVDVYAVGGVLSAHVCG